MARPSIARTNIRAANSNRSLPRGTGTGSLPLRIRRAQPEPQPRPPSITIVPPTQPPPLAEPLAIVLAQRDRLMAIGLSRLRDNMPAYKLRYRAAYAVRSSLGDAKWQRLEEERIRIVRFACIMRKLDREQRPGPRAFLDKNFPCLEAYVERVWGKYVREFRMMLDTMESVIEEEAAMGMGVQSGVLMSSMREFFHRSPYFWFVCNLYFPVRGKMGEPGRMTWVQLKDWAIWALQNPTQKPSWWLKGGEQVPLPAVSSGDLIWNAALIEAFRDFDLIFDSEPATKPSEEP